MKRIFTTNLLLLLAVNLVVKPFWIFGIDRSVQNMLGAQEYGLFYTLFNFSIIFSILLDFGITNFNNREISRHPQLLDKYLANIVGLRFLLALLYGVVTLCAALFLGYCGRQLSILLLLVLNQFLSSLILYLRSNLSGLQLFRLDSMLSVVDKSLMILICGLLLWTQLVPVDFSVEIFVLVQTMSYVLTAIIVFVVVVSKAGKIAFRIDIPFSISTLRKSIPYAILMLLMMLYGRVDSIAIERIMPGGSEAAGVYAQAFRLLDAANMFPYLFASLLLPIYSRMIKNRSKLGAFVGFSALILMIPVLSLAIPTIFFRGDIMNWLYIEHAQHSSIILGILMGSFVFIALGYIFGTLLTARGDLRNLNKLSAVAVLVSISLQVILVNSYGTVGAAWGNLGTNMMVALLSLWLVFKGFRFGVNYLFVGKCIAFVILAVVASMLWRQSGVHSGVAYVLAIITALASAFVSRLIRLRELLSFFTKASLSD
ncbi:MAG: oligosaccharide flippase family protein [Bacteroidales bacterium]|nr:oligosaccharide flippase family protein [Bacteroidales bacterium]